jgi:DNA-3-methyladenine glycosylase
VTTHIDGHRVSIQLTEVEAYGGNSDPASHASGSRTSRNAPMWGPPGTLYVYLSYGIHWCANIVVGRENEPGAVLIRGGVVTEGRGTVERRRGRPVHLADGPGKIGQALGLNGSDSGTTVWDGPLALRGPFGSVESWYSTVRIGISKAIDVPWRFVVEDSSALPSSTLP